MLFSSVIVTMIVAELLSGISDLTSGLAKEDHSLGKRWLHLNPWKVNSKDIRTTTGARQQIVNVCTAIAIAA
jgi:hypothetical protein